MYNFWCFQASLSLRSFTTKHTYLLMETLDQNQIGTTKPPETKTPKIKIPVIHKRSYTQTSFLQGEHKNKKQSHVPEMTTRDAFWDSPSCGNLRLIALSLSLSLYLYLYLSVPNNCLLIFLWVFVFIYKASKIWFILESFTAQIFFCLC